MAEENNNSEDNQDTVVAENTDIVASAPEDQDAIPAEAGEQAAIKDAKDRKPEKKEWYIDTITGLRAGKRESDKKAEDLAAQNEALLAALAAAKNGETVAPEIKQETLPEAEIERRAQVKAIEIAASENFNKTCNDVYESGKSAFTDFDDALANLNAVGALGPNVNPAFLQAVVELPNSEKLLHHLGTNPDEAAKLTKLTPLKMAIELAKIESAISNPKPKKLSEVPPPIQQVNGRGKADMDLSDPSLDTARWMEMRRAEKAKRAAN